MRYLNRGPEPDSWTQYKLQNASVRYAELDLTARGKEIRQEMRSHLVVSQLGLCAYCCSRITVGSSHNEHVRPESLFPNETMEYENLVASCERKGTCGSAKGSHYDDAFVSPLEPDCASHFRFYPDGSVEGTDERGKLTCELLKLNSYRLRDARRAMLASLMSWADENSVRAFYLTPRDDGTLEQFADMLQQMCDEGFFTRAEWD